MVLIADSGSTKTDWALLENGAIAYHQTSGLNPLHLKDDALFKVIVQEELLPKMASEPEAIFFYGAGCAFREVNSNLQSRFHDFFPNAEIHVGSDLLAAGRALLGDEAGIIGILGTGSNTGRYENNHIVKNVPSLGYVIGDFGSGSHLGRVIISDFFKGKMPEYIENRFRYKYYINLSDLLDKVYRQSQPNRYLASFANFIYENIEHEYMHDLVCKAFDTYFIENIDLLPLDRTKETLNFTGSIAHYFTPQLRIIGERKGYTLGHVSKSPISLLVDYHNKKTNV